MSCVTSFTILALLFWLSVPYHLDRRIFPWREINSTHWICGEQSAHVPAWPRDVWLAADGATPHALTARSMLPMHRDAIHGVHGAHGRPSHVQEMQMEEPEHTVRQRGVTLVTPDGYATESTTGAPPANVAPARWGTWEFRVYYLAALFIVPYMIYVPISFSSESRPQFGQYAHLLVPGWMGGRQRVRMRNSHRTTATCSTASCGSFQVCSVR